MNNVAVGTCKGAEVLNDDIIIEKRVGATDVKYKILTCGSKFDVPKGTEVTVVFNDKTYDAKMHNNTIGRIDRLAALYKNFNLNVGDVLKVSYDPSQNYIHLQYVNSSGKTGSSNDDVVGADDFNFSDFEEHSEVSAPNFFDGYY